MLVSKNSLNVLTSRFLRPIKDEKKITRYINIVPNCADGVMVAVNKENDFVDELTNSNLKAIYSGKENMERC